MIRWLMGRIGPIDWRGFAQTDDSPLINWCFEHGLPIPRGVFRVSRTITVRWSNGPWVPRCMVGTPRSTTRIEPP